MIAASSLVSFGRKAQEICLCFRNGAVMALRAAKNNDRWRCEGNSCASMGYTVSPCLIPSQWRYVSYYSDVTWPSWRLQYVQANNKGKVNVILGGDTIAPCLTPSSSLVPWGRHYMEAFPHYWLFVGGFLPQKASNAKHWYILGC